MSDNPLGQLLVVQDLDTSGDQLRHRRAHLAERVELAGVEQEMAAVRADLAGADSERQALGERQRVAEEELAATETRSGAVTRRLFGGEVSASRDLQAMSGELDQLKSRASALEDAVLEVMEAREPLDARSAELRRQLDDLERRQAELVVRAESVEAAIDAELAELTTRREAAARPVPEALLATYERLRSRLGGVGMARLDGARCGGCHLTLPAAELETVRHLPGGQVYQCEQCSRILVP